MAVNPLQLVEVDDDAVWDAGVDASPQGTVFCRAAYLRALGMPVRRLSVQSAGRILALLPAVEDAGGRRLLQPPFTPYQGFLFLHEAHTLPRQRVLDEFRLSEFLVAELARRYDAVSLALSWQFTDLRPFLWHNYHEAGQPRYQATPRYTALLKLQDVTAETLTAEARACRRQELRKAAQCTVSEGRDVETFMALYARTFARQDIALPDETLALVRRITEAAVGQGYGRLSACSTPQGTASMNLFLYDRRRAYYLFAANDPALRNSGAATRLMFDNIEHARQRGLAELDFVGVNSPNRGDFKLSFNPELKLYFEVALQAA